MSSTKIVRTPTKAHGGIMADEKKSMDALVVKWKKIAFKTGPLDREKIEEAIKGLYRVSGLKEPRVIIVPSPKVMAFAYGLSAGILFLRKNIQATYQATDQATRQATEQATDKWLFPMALNFVGGDIEKAKFLISCISRWYSVYQGGNMWAGHHSYYEAARDILKLKGLDCWKKYQAWEDCGKLGGFRVMHEDFCIVSDFPEILKVNANNQSHCENGPSHRWADGWEFYHLNGVKVPKWLVMTDAGQIDPQLALTEKNVDIQREIIRKVGAERILKACNAKTLDIFIDRHSKGGNEYKLMEMKIGNINRKYLCFEHASLPGVWYAQPIPPNTRKAIHGRAWILGIGELEELETKSEQEIMEYLPLEVS